MKDTGFEIGQPIRGDAKSNATIYESDAYTATACVVYIVRNVFYKRQSRRPSALC
jgi:hypothetical protein